MSKVKPIPDGASALTPYLSCTNASEMIDFYKKAFGATEKFRLTQSDGRIGHAEIAIGGASLMLADEFPEMGFLSPKSLPGGARSPVAIHLYVEDVDATHLQAMRAGATSLKEPTDEFFGDRNAHLKDPSGHVWFLSARIEEVSPAEMQRRFNAMMKEKVADMETKHIQPGYTTITPYLYAKLDLIDFLKRAFGAEVTHTPTPDEKENFHAEAKIGNAHLLLGSGYFSDPSMAAAIYLYVPDVDATYKRALGLGATSVREPSDQTWGDRVGGVKDTSGNTWWIATHKAAK